MGSCLKIFLAISAILTILIGLKINSLLEVPPMPVLEETWWGQGQAKKVDTSIRPFKIDIPDKVITDLTQRLKTARPFTPPLEGIQQQYGMNTKLLAEIVEFWKTKYDWKERQNFLNQYPQFKTNIQGLNIHFLHVKPTNTKGLKVLPLLLLHGWPGSVREFYELIPLLTTPQPGKVLPLLLLHGWPGSVREFYELIPLLTTPQPGKDFIFEVIAPSLPGYGFSDGASKPGLSAVKVGLVFKNLMCV
ncbi:alpha/beta hydrolase fold [Popillia japonica]|uniref:Alpha/beta hydrolase fold n=1 Tax=Popillia japonica TaxID=7064 RepID=A0AAW1LFB4_POPJA